jgi:hypothetical protein
MNKDEHIQVSAKQVRFLQSKSAALVASPDSTSTSEFSLALIELRELLPPRLYCDRLVAIYCDHYERTFRVLHIPTFQKQYEQFWTSSSHDACSPSLLPQLTAMMIMAYHMDDVDQNSDDFTYKSYLKGAAIEHVQGWLDGLSRRNRTELHTLQVEILLVLAKSLRGLHPEKLWSSTGGLVRSAMVMGLHLDPTTIISFTPYQAEMRRRLWATILEIDLQASITTGLPLVLPEIQALSLPSNLNDCEFDENSANLPSAHPREAYTDNTYQIVLASSLPFRIKAVSLVQRSAAELQETLTLGRKLKECLHSKPQVVSLTGGTSAPPGGGSLLHRVLLDLYLRRPILCLYKPLLLGQQQASPCHKEIQKHCLDSSLAILAYQELYTLPALNSVTASPMAHQDFFYRCCRMDVLWAALTCCQRIIVLQEASSEVRSQQQSGSHDTSLITTVQSTIENMIERIGRKGSDLKDIVFLALALRSAQRSSTPADKPAALHQAVKTTLAACRERLLQPMLTSDPTRQTGPPPKRSRTSHTSALQANTSPPMFNFRTAPITDNMTFPFDLSDPSQQQWFDSLPDLAAEYTDFQAHLSDPSDPLNFGMSQDWDWERMWQ